MFSKFRNKYISILILAAFFILNLHDYSFAIQPAMPINNPILFAPLNLNNSIGEVVESFSGDKNEKVICIEDLHCSPAVQENIAKVIKQVKADYRDKFKFIGIEGSVGNIDVSLFSKIPNQDVKNKIINKYLKDGSLSGAELYAIQEDANVKIFGLEDKDLYMKDFSALYKSFGYYDKWNNVAKNMEESMNNVKDFLYIEQLKKFEENINLYQSGKISLFKYVNFLVNVAAKYNINIERNYPNISNYYSMQKLYDSITFTVLDTEMRYILNNLKPYLTQQDLKNLVATKKNKEEYYFTIYRILKDKKVLLDRTYRETSKYILYNDRNNEFDKVLFLQEKDRLEYEIKLAISKGQAQLNKFLMCNRYLQQMKLYFDNKTDSNTAKDWKANKDMFFKNMTTFGNLFGKENVFKNNQQLLKQIDSNMDDFYNYADKRNEVILDNLFDNSKDSPVKVVIFGGYHTNGMIEFLRGKGISFEIIRPAIPTAYPCTLR